MAPLASIALLLVVAPAASFTAQRSPFFAPPKQRSGGAGVVDGSRRAQVVVGSSREAFKEAAAAGMAGGDPITSIADPSLPVSDQWELDCYSRPVTVGGKKLWELLITDATGNFRHVEPIPANKVNSREVRARIEKVISESPVRPKQIRFFRRAMFNMLSIALTDISTGLVVKPSRSTYALYTWIEQREKDVYPKMGGYKPALSGAGSFFDIATPEKLPDALRAEQFAFVSLPVSEVMAGGDVSSGNIGVGKMCPVPEGVNPDAMLAGVLFITKRSENLAALLAGSELAFVKADLKRRELVMETGLSTRFLTAKLTDEQRIEAQAFETGKARLKGLHFIGVQSTPEDEDVKGFWLCREMANL